MPDYRGHEIKLCPGNFGVVLAQVYRDGHLLMVPGGDLHFAELTAEEALRRAKRWIDTKFVDAPDAADEDMDNAMEVSFLISELQKKDEENRNLKAVIADLLAELSDTKSKLADETVRGQGAAERNIRLMKRDAAVARGFERVMKIARHWRDFAMKQAQEIAHLKAQREGSFKEFCTAMDRLQAVRKQRDALIAMGHLIDIKECGRCELPALVTSPSGNYCLNCNQEAKPMKEPRTAANTSLVERNRNDRNTESLGEGNHHRDAGHHCRRCDTGRINGRGQSRGRGRAGGSDQSGR